MYANERKFSYSGKLFYGYTSRQAYNHSYGAFNGGIGLFFQLKYNNYRAIANIVTGFSLDSTNRLKEIGHKGQMDLEFGYHIPVRWEPIIFSWNNYDELALEKWDGYTGAGTNILIYNNNYIELMLTAGLASQYTKYMRDDVFNTGPRLKAELAYVFKGKFTCFPHKRVKVELIWKILPVQDFLEADISTLIRLSVATLRGGENESIGVDIVTTLSVVHCTKHNTSSKQTDYTYFSGVKLFM